MTEFEVLLIRVRVCSTSNSNSNSVIFSVRISSVINELVLIALIVAIFVVAIIFLFVAHSPLEDPLESQPLAGQPNNKSTDVCLSIYLSVCLSHHRRGRVPLCSMCSYVENCKIRTNVNNFVPLYIPTCVPGGVKIEILQNINRTTRKTT